MQKLFQNEQFARNYEKMANVSLNPRRHTAGNAKDHSDEVASVAVQLGKANGCDEDDLSLLEQLGYAHDIGKVAGTARPQKSVDLLKDFGVSDEQFLRFVKWHDVSLPWYRSAMKGQPPSDKAWRRLAREVDLRLLTMFMVADRSDAPPGWRRNAPTNWFIEEARRRGLVEQNIELDLDGQPSEISCGGAVVRQENNASQVLVIRVCKNGFELPKGGIEWDEIPSDAALREVRGESGLRGPIDILGELGHLEYRVQRTDGGNHIKRVRYYHLRAREETEVGSLPERTRERRWVSLCQLVGLELVNEGLRPLLKHALGGAF